MIFRHIALANNTPDQAININITKITQSRRPPLPYLPPPPPHTHTLIQTCKARAYCQQIGWESEWINASGVLFLYSQPTVNKSRVKLRPQRMCFVGQNLHESSVIDWVKRFPLSVSHFSSLSDDLFRPVPVLLWSIPSPTDTA